MNSLNNSNALLFYIIGRKQSGGDGGGDPIVPPSGKWETIVTDSTDGYLSFDKQKQNAANVWNFFKGHGWSNNALYALLGNMTGESTMNPGLIEVGGGTTTAGAGRGLVQWTPATNLFDVLNVLYGTYTDWYDGDKQLAALYAEYQESVGEAHRGIEPQWYQTANYPISYKEWAHDTTHTIEYLVYAYMANYLRPGTIDHPERVTYAMNWKTYFGG